MVSFEKKQRQRGQRGQRGQRRSGVGSQRCGRLSLFPSTIALVTVTVTVIVKMVVVATLLVPSQVEGTVYLPQFNRSYTSLPGLFGKPIHGQDPPVSAYLTTIPNQPYMCPDELKNIRPKPPQQFLNNSNKDKDKDKDNVMASSTTSSNTNSNNIFNNTADDADWIEPLPAPEDGLPIALLVERGLCTFWDKAEMASKYGPSVQYVIIFDNIISPDLVPMASDYKTDITLLFVSALSGHELRDLIHTLPRPGDNDNDNDNEIAMPPTKEHENSIPAVNGHDGHEDGLLILIDGERPIPDEPFPSLQAAAYFLAAMSGFLAFLIFFGCLLICAQCGCITAAPDEHGRIVLFAGGPGIRHTEGLARMIRVHKLTREQVETLDEEEFSAGAAVPGGGGGGEDEGDSSCCCCICLDEFEDREKVRVLPCGHKFHGDCLVPWLTERDASCPLCKMDVLKHVLETEKKNKAERKDNGDNDDDHHSEADKERRAAALESSDEEGDPGATDDRVPSSRGTSPVRSVWYRLRGWSLISAVAPSEHQGETEHSLLTRSSLEVVSEIEMENRSVAVRRTDAELAI